MNPAAVIFGVLSVLAASSEASSLFKYFPICGGRKDVQQQNYKKGQVLPAANFDDDDMTLNLTPFNSDRNPKKPKLEFSQDDELKYAFEGNVPTTKKTQKYMTKLAAVAPEEDELDDVSLNMNSIEKPIEFKSESDENSSESEYENVSYTQRLKMFLDGNGIHIENLNVSEKGARELLQIKIPLMIVLSYEKRTELMVYELQVDNSAVRSQYVDAKIFRIDNEIAEDLTRVKTLKDLLKIVVKFYKKCFANLLSSKCAKAILAADVFDIDELPEVFGMSFNELFQFACENHLNDLALELVERISSVKINLREAAFKAHDDGNYELSGELLEILREKFGDDANSEFHNVLYQIVDEQIIA